MKGPIYERLGYSFFRAATQADEKYQFKERITQSVSNYKIAHEFFARQTRPQEVARSLRCQAMIAYLGSWLASDPLEKKRMMVECWSLTTESLKAFGETESALEYGKTFNLLSVSAILAVAMEWDRQAAERIMKQALDNGEKAVRLLSATKSIHELARAYVKSAALHEGFGFYFVDLDGRGRYSQQAQDYLAKARELSEESAMLELASPLLTGMWNLGGAVGSDNAVENFEKALAYGKRARDKLAIGSALDWLALHITWKEMVAEDPDERVQLGNRALECAEDALQNYSRISFVSPLADVLWVEAPYSEHYWRVALFETDLEKKRDQLDQAVKAATELLDRAKNYSYLDVMWYAAHTFSKATAALAQTQANQGEKRRLLKEALEHRNEAIRIVDHEAPFCYWDRGINRNHLADINSQLADLAEDVDTKKDMLEAAISNKEESLKLCKKEALFWLEKTGQVSMLPRLGNMHYEYGELLNRLYDLTENKSHLQKAANALEDAAESFQTVNQFSRMAECFWKAAQAYEALGEYLKAGEKFALASKNYGTAADKISQLRVFYLDHASYMEAWSEIEKARYHHVREEYSSARESYERTTNLHKTTKEWGFLASNYSAWAQVENGEDLSRKEQSEEAIQAFEQAARLFSETKATLQKELSKLENVDKKQMVASLIRGADLRREYCMGRVALEEAKLLDRKGDHHSSSQRYGQGAETFEKLTQQVETEQARRELKPIATLSRAWEMMTRAEAEASPELYLQASRLFEEAKEQNPSEKARSLALGNSRFCRALEAGTRFADTGEVSLHATAIQHLESAAKYYLKAGFKDASEYAEATELLFDAYLHMDEAKREKDHEKKAKLYSMTEKVLQASADSFFKAKHPAKREQVLRLLDRVKRERELALSLTEVLRSPAFVSATAVFSAPAPTRERAVGLDRFEYADVQASLITRQRHLKVGEDLALEIELVNAGKGPAQVLKIEELVPEGFELTGKPEPYRVEDNYLNMKGKRLDPLKTEEVKLVLKPRVQGQFTLKPRIMYLDESGKYKSHEPEPIEVTVKELGISGWLKGR